MATAIINSQMDAINESFSNISSDLTTIRPLLKNAAIGAYPTDTASGSIASFTDGAEDIPVKSLSVDLEPIQDLNGYDNPWPAGGGKNLYDDTTIIHGSFTTASVTINPTEAYRTVKLTLPAGTYTFSCDLENCFIIRGVWDGAVHAINWAAASYTFTSTEEGTVAFCFRNTSTSTITDTVHVQVEIGSTATAYEPYSNVCPISGHTEVNVYRTGKNLLDVSKSESGGIDGSGNLVSGNQLWRATEYIPALPSTYYTFSGATAQLTYRIYFYDSNKTFLGRTNDTSISTAQTPSNCAYLKWSIYRGTNITQSDVEAWDLQLELGSTATDYVPFAGFDTYPISLGQTVYGGTLNVTTGVLTVDRAMRTISTLSWIAGTAGERTYFKAPITDKPVPTSGDSTPIMATNIKYAGILTVAQMPDASLAQAPRTHEVRIYDSAVTTKSEMLDKYGTGQFVYYLATPATIQLAPTQVSTLLGANNIFADAGEISVVYRADTGLYIDKKLAQALNA